MWRGLIELGGVGTLQSAGIAGIFNGCNLHAETNPEIGYVVLSGVLGGVNLALGAAVTKSTGD